MRTTVTEDEFGGLRVEIRPKANWPIRLTLILLTGFWIALAGLFTYLAWKKPEQTSAGHLIGLLVFWLCGLACFIFMNLLLYAGREVIRMDDETVQVGRAIGRHQRSRSFEATRVSGLRYAPGFDPSGFRLDSLTISWYQVESGVIAFDDGPVDGFPPRICRFGDQLDEEESSRLLATIRLRYKFPDQRPAEPLPILRRPTLIGLPIDRDVDRPAGV